MAWILALCSLGLGMGQLLRALHTQASVDASKFPPTQKSRPSRCMWPSTARRRSLSDSKQSVCFHTLQTPDLPYLHKSVHYRDASFQPLLRMFISIRLFTAHFSNRVVLHEVDNRKASHKLPIALFVCTDNGFFFFSFFCALKTHPRLARTPL